MEQIMNYVKPELIVAAVALYFIGIGLCTIWVLGNSPLGTGQDIAMAVFTAIVQGILVAGLSTYINQIIKQTNKTE